MIEEIPEKFEMLSFFESEPFEQIEQEGYYCYKFEDCGGLSIVFSFNQFEGSIQVILEINNQELCLVSTENVRKIKVSNEKNGEFLKCMFSSNEETKDFYIQLRPCIKVTFTSIVN